MSHSSRWIFAVVLFSVTLSRAADPKQLLVGSHSATVPISFEQNVGQTESRYAFLLHRHGMTAGFRPTGMDVEIQAGTGKRVRFPVEFGDAATTLMGEDHLQGKVNYLVGADRSRWLSNVNTVGRIRYKSAFRGIDLVFYGNPGEVEHDFIVAPGADASLIRLRIPATIQIDLSSEGDAYLRLDDAVLKFKRPIAYQDTPQGRRSVDARFKVTDHAIAFHVGDYDRTLPLVIDPALVFSTYMATGSAPVTGVATDSNGNTYIVGYAFSEDVPLTNPLQPKCSACPNYTNLFVTKLNATGTAAIFSTYFGGSDYDTPVGIQVDSSGNVIVAGSTNSPDFPVKNGLPSGTPSYVVALGFVSSLSPDGSSLNYSTLLGHGSSNLSTLAVGPDGSAYVSGRTYDPLFPVTPGAVNLATPGYPDGPVFLCKVSPAGTLIYSGIIGDPDPQNGGGGYIGVTGMAVDSQGAAYMHGNAGLLWPTTAGAYETSIPGDSPYAAPFITKVAPDGKSVVYSTFLGPSNGVAPAAIAVNASGEAWITGAYAGSTFPITPDAFSGTLPAGYWYGAAYLSKLSTDGRALLYSTYLFGDDSSTNTQPTALELDVDGHVWIAGSTKDASFPLVHPIQAAFSYQNYTGFVLEFDQNAKTLLFSTSFGTQNGSAITGMAIDPATRVHLGGWAMDGLYTTPGVYIGAAAPPPPGYQYLYPFTAVLDPAANSATICLASQPGFPVTKVGTSSSEIETISNCGTANLSLSSFTSSDSHFVVPPAHNGCSSTLVPGASCSLEIDFAPTAETTVNATLKIGASDSGVIPGFLMLNGMGATPHVGLWENQLQFPQLLIGKTSTQWIEVDNTGSIPLNVNVPGIVINGDYSYSVNYCPQPLGPYDYCLFYVTFTPTASGERDGTFTIPTDDLSNPTLKVTLLGSAVSAYPIPVINSFDYGTAAVGATNVTAKVNGSGFSPESVVNVNGTALKTTYFSSQTLGFKIDSALLVSMGELSVTVTNPTPGGGTSNILPFTVYKSLSGSFNHLVYNRSTQLLYATVPSSASVDANTVLVIDPATGTIRSRIQVGNNPNQIGLSSDDRYLFVGFDGDHVIRRINCSTQVVERTYTLPNDQMFGGPR
jgi:hypothetical protein